jgi:hypothetical protein
MNNGLFLLQNPQYWKEDNPIEGYILLGIAGGLILIALVAGFVRNGINTGAGPGGAKSAATPRKFNFFTLRRIAKNYGLNRDQTRLLEFIFRSNEVGDPEQVMKNAALLDKYFKHAYRAIEQTSKTEEEVQQRLVSFFSLRNAIEAAAVPGSAASTKLAGNTAAVLSTGKESYPVRVISAQGTSVVVENPKNALGTPVKIANGSRVTLSFFTKSSKGFAFDSKVTGVTGTSRGPELQLSHSGEAKPLAQRRYRRKQVTTGCVLYVVVVETVKAGRKKVSKLVVDKRRFVGTVQDISIGGCSIKTSAPVQIGERIKLDIDHGGGSALTVLGQILRTNRAGVTGTIIHVKFIKIPRKAFNNINALVFGYDKA